jgi:hypothetical protein
MNNPKQEITLLTKIEQENGCTAFNIRLVDNDIMWLKKNLDN